MPTSDEENERSSRHRHAGAAHAIRGTANAPMQSSDTCTQSEEENRDHKRPRGGDGFRVRIRLAGRQDMAVIVPCKPQRQLDWLIEEASTRFAEEFDPVGNSAPVE